MDSPPENKPEVIETALVVDARDLLPEEERKELTKYEETVLVADPRRTLAPGTATKFFQLFLNGYSPREIQELNPTFPLGMIIHARVKYGWDLEREGHVKELMGRVREKVLLTQLESAHYLTDVMSAIHKLNGNKIKKYLQTGDPKDLEGMNIEALNNYSKTFELVAKLTGQDRGKAGSASPIQVVIPQAPITPLPGEESRAPAQTRTEKALSSDEAAEVVRALLEIKKVRDDKKNG